MQYRVILTVAALLATGQVLAGGHEQPPQTAPVTATGGDADATSKSLSAAKAKAAATAQAAAGADASNGGVSTDIEGDSVRFPRQNVPALLGDVQPTISCATARNGGASSPVVALSFGLSGKDKECDKREAAKEFRVSGRNDLSIEVLCTTEAAKGIANCQPLAPEPAPVVQGDYVTHKDMQEVERRIIQHETSK